MTNIYDYALKMEKDSEDLYRELSSDTSHEGVKKILNMLADEEAKHYEIITKMKKNVKELLYEDTNVLENSKNIIEKIKENKEKIDIKSTQVKIYEEAQKIEKESIKFYEEKSKEVTSEKQKKIFLKLAKEEEKHFFILNDILIHVSRPQTWVENADFNLREEY